MGGRRKGVEIDQEGGGGRIGWIIFKVNIFITKQGGVNYACLNFAFSSDERDIYLP